MMRMPFKHLAVAVALGTAMAAGAQTSSYPAATPSANQPATAAEKAPASKENPCANVAAAEKEACMAKENAKKSGSAAAAKPSDSATPSASAPSASPPSKSESAAPKSDSTSSTATTAPTK